jgi:lipopolysaccharide transport system ATP-binding protein
MRPIIRIDGVGKRYRLGARASYRTLRESIVETAYAPLRALRSGLNGSKRDGRGRPGKETVWSLKDVSFDVKPGEAVGVIGRNGAGKSTLLKILSRITDPTEGSVDLYGRVGSLLEVGSGFHPELTGRENIFLNGAILGMSRQEVRRKFDEIVAFSEVETYLDTPVKRYSSGMYMRLAFAVAAHLEPEILLVDEVLAVGDAGFQKRCLDKMKDVSGHGRTVLFVSHNMPAVTRLCQRTVLLDKGTVLADGPSHQVVSKYLSSGLGTTAAREWPDPAEAPGDNVARLRAVRVRADDGSITEAVDIRRPVGLEMEFDVLEGGHVLAPNYHVLNEEGAFVFVAIDQDPEWKRRPRPKGRYVATARIPGNFLSEGTLIITAALTTMTPMAVHFVETEAVAFQVIDSLDGDSARGDYAGPIPGAVRPMLEWSNRFVGA